MSISLTNISVGVQDHITQSVVTNRHYHSISSGVFYLDFCTPTRSRFLEKSLNNDQCFPVVWFREMLTIEYDIRHLDMGGINKSHFKHSQKKALKKFQIQNHDKYPGKIYIAEHIQCSHWLNKRMVSNIYCVKGVGDIENKYCSECTIHEAIV